MMLEWREELQKLDEKKVDFINQYIGEHYEWGASEAGKKKIKKWLSEFGFELVLEAIDIAFNKYYEGDKNTWIEAFNKVSGVCFNKTYQAKNGNATYYYNYIAKACMSKYASWSSELVYDYVNNYIRNEDDFEKVKKILRHSRFWWEFKRNMDEEFS